MQIPDGTIIEGRLRVGNKIGSGGMGTVFEGTLIQIERPVAIKFLTDLGVSPEEAFGRFQQEAQVLSQLDDPHIVRVFAFGRWMQYPYMVMERVHGSSLQDRIDKGVFVPANEMVRWAIQILRGLAVAHAAGVVHRDLKPGNVLITDAGAEAKIIDFGLAKVIGRNTPERRQLTEAGTALGSVLYMSPEQCIAQTQIDGRSDLYALGCLMHHCMAGLPPFIAEHPIQVMVLHTDASVVAPRIPSIDQGLQNVVDKAMSKDVRRRYQNAQEMICDLELLQQGQAPFAVAVKLPGAPRVPSLPRFRKAWMAWVLVGLALVMCGLGGYTLLSPSDVPAPAASSDHRSIASLAADVELAERVLRDRPYQQNYATASQAYARLALAEEHLREARGEYAKNYAMRVFVLEHDPVVATPMLVRLAPNIMLGHPDRQVSDINELMHIVPDVAFAEGDYALARTGYEVLLRICEKEDKKRFGEVQKKLKQRIAECDHGCSGDHL